MKEVSFADKVNSAFEAGWKSNPNFTKALREVESVVSSQEKKSISVQEMFLDELNNDKTVAQKEDDEAR